MPWSVHVFVNPRAPRDGDPKRRVCLVQRLITIQESNVGRYDLSTLAHSWMVRVVLLSVHFIAGRSIILYAIATSCHLSWETAMCMLIDLPLEHKISRSALLLPSGASHAPKLRFPSDVLLCSIGTHVV